MSDWKFAHHSLKANSVKVLGPIVPQYVGSTVRAGCTPVLDLCHLWKRKGVEKKMETEIKLLQFRWSCLQTFLDSVSSTNVLANRMCKESHQHSNASYAEEPPQRNNLFFLLATRMSECMDRYRLASLELVGI